jgi:mannose-6-phosphate isomerase-like protein (cupin superfamily)
VRRVERGIVMGFVLTENHFGTEAEALEEIAERGLHALTIDIPAEDNDLHWHDFDAVLFVLDGIVRVEFEDGSAMQCGAGARVEAPAGVLHREASPAHRIVFGFGVEPTEMTHPINKPGAPTPPP